MCHKINPATPFQLSLRRNNLMLCWRSNGILEYSGIPVQLMYTFHKPLFSFAWNSNQLRLIFNSNWPGMKDGIRMLKTDQTPAYGKWQQGSINLYLNMSNYSLRLKMLLIHFKISADPTRKIPDDFHLYMLKHNSVAKHLTSNHQVCESHCKAPRYLSEGQNIRFSL